jgi:hypothetical protein
MSPSLTSKPPILLSLATLGASAQTWSCDLREYHQTDGLRAAMANHELQLTWQGKHGEELRGAFAIHDAQSTIRELAIHKPGAAWPTLARDLTPEFDVVSGTLDDMNNQAGSKYLIAEGDTYTEYPDNETYPELQVNYIKLAKLPRFDEDWSPVLRALQKGQFFVTSGEVLIRSQGSTAIGKASALTFDVEWTFPLEFVESVWSDGEKTGSHKFSFPFDPTCQKWMRFAALDSACNGAFTQPAMLNMPK